MSLVKHHKFVAALPAQLEADSVYYVRAGTGFDHYVTNSSGTIVAYPTNPRWHSLAAPTVAGGVLTMDLSAATDFKVMLGEGVTDMRLVGVPQGSAVEFSVAWTQNSLGGNTVAFPSNFYGAGEAITQPSGEPGAMTVQRFVTFDGGETFLQTLSVVKKEQAHIQVFSASGSYSVPAGVRSLDVLIVGGGGGGGSRQGGGGGAGGVRLVTLSVKEGDTFAVAVGAGGAGGTSGGRGSNGQPSAFGTYSVLGGGGGGGRTTNPSGANGASGGGGARNFDNGKGGQGTLGLGTSGGAGSADYSAGVDINVGAGGGGAGLSGFDGTGTETTGVGGSGGEGRYFPGLTAYGGFPAGWFGGGGGGGVWASTKGGVGGKGGGGAGAADGINIPAVGVSGVPNTGGGGGGSNATDRAGGAGGSGVVIVIRPAHSIQATAPAITAQGATVTRP